MGAERWERINRLFIDCLPLPRDQRAALLEVRCPEDCELLAEVEAILEADDANRDGFLGSACPASLGNLLLDAGWDGRNGTASGRCIGGYRLLGLIGKGGTSEVYRAGLLDEEGQAGSEFKPREVAFKLISSQMATEEAVRRFRTEQELLATIDPPTSRGFSTVA
jgi:hypothetical protein